MRVSTNMLSSNFMSSLNKSLERQNKLQEQLSDGKAIHRPSDDPIKTIRSLRFNISLKENEQYTQQVKDATSWMETTDGAMSDLSSLTIKAKELVVKSIAPNPDMALDAIGNELDGIINQMIQIGNTKIGDRYVFAGQNDKIEPFQRQTGLVMTNPDGTQTQFEGVVYQGDTNKISMRVQPGSVNPFQDSVNLTGEQAFGPLQTATAGTEPVQTATILNNLIKIKEVLKGEDSQHSRDLQWLSSEGIKMVDDGHNHILQAHTELGARMSMYEQAEALLEKNNVIITGDVSANEDLDIAKAMIDFKTSESVYRTALSIGAKIMPPSLADFLN